MEHRSNCILSTPARLDIGPALLVVTLAQDPAGPGGTRPAAVWIRSVGTSTTVSRRALRHPVPHPPDPVHQTHPTAVPPGHCGIQCRTSSRSSPTAPRSRPVPPRRRRQGRKCDGSCLERVPRSADACIPCTGGAGGGSHGKGAPSRVARAWAPAWSRTVVPNRGPEPRPRTEVPDQNAPLARAAGTMPP